MFLGCPEWNQIYKANWKSCMSESYMNILKDIFHWGLWLSWGNDYLDVIVGQYFVILGFFLLIFWVVKILWLLRKIIFVHCEKEAQNQCFPILWKENYKSKALQKNPICF